MKKILSLSTIFLIISSCLFGQTTKRVLFLGNSYTYVNNLPAILESLARNTGDSLFHDQNTPGGYTLSGHSTNPTSIALIKQGSWDYVVLQEQSQKPSWPMSQVITEVFPYAKILSNTIVQHNSCGKPLFFMTWGRKNGDAGNCASWPPVCTYAGMDSLLNLRYRMMADSNDAYVSPVGAVWHYIRDNHPSIELYSGDGSHPSPNGSYAAACTFYSLVFQKDPSLITDNNGLDPIVAANIRAASKIVAFDSLAKWNVGKYVPEAQFTTNQSNDTVHFSNNSKYGDSYNWTFGDGTNSILFEPSHYYKQSGNYQVVLEVSKCGLNDTISKNIQITLSSIESNIDLISKIYPNPISNQINLEFKKAEKLNNILFYDLNGKIIKSFGNLEGQYIKLIIENLAQGTYLLQFEIEGRVYQHKIIK